MPSPFDFESFTATTYDATGIDYKWHSVPEGAYIGQIKEFRGRDLPADKFNNRPVVGMDITWSIVDENVKLAMNIEEPQARQGMILELTRPADEGGTIDWGTNKNMALKRVIEACGLSTTKKLSLGMLLNQTAWVTITHRANEKDPESPFADVSRVEDLIKGRAAAELRAAAQ